MFTSPDATNPVNPFTGRVVVARGDVVPELHTHVVFHTRLPDAPAGNNDDVATTPPGDDHVVNDHNDEDANDDADVDRLLTLRPLITDAAATDAAGDSSASSSAP